LTFHRIRQQQAIICNVVFQTRHGVKATLDRYAPCSFGRDRTLVASLWMRSNFDLFACWKSGCLIPLQERLWANVKLISSPLNYKSAPVFCEHVPNCDGSWQLIIFLYQQRYGNFCNFCVIYAKFNWVELLLYNVDIWFKHNVLAKNVL